MEFVNGKDDISYMTWKIKLMFETTKQFIYYDFRKFGAQLFFAKQSLTKISEKNRKSLAPCLDSCFCTHAGRKNDDLGPC